jgi:hypothetical protein
MPSFVRLYPPPKAWQASSRRTESVPSIVKSAEASATLYGRTCGDRTHTKAFTPSEELRLSTPIYCALQKLALSDDSAEACCPLSCRHRPCVSPERAIRSNNRQLHLCLAGPPISRGAGCSSDPSSEVTVPPRRSGRPVRWPQVGKVVQVVAVRPDLVAGDPATADQRDAAVDHVLQPAPFGNPTGCDGS